MRLGTNSPKMMVTKVMTVTTTAVALIDAALSVKPQPCSTAPKLALKAASPTMPLSMPIDVMPTCTVDKNRVGWSMSLSAAAAPWSPPSAMATKRSRRLADSAISDMANTPFNSVRMTMSRTSMATMRAWHCT
jgi:hypothetical protein